MDGLKPTSHVIVMAATNRPAVLDTALRRFGRFDREIDLGIPDDDGRLQILQRKAKTVQALSPTYLRLGSCMTVAAPWWLCLARHVAVLTRRPSACNAQMRLGADVDLAKIAEDTHGYCGADLSQLVTEAAMQCVRERAGDIDVDAEDVDADVLESFVISQRHIAGAMEKTAPSSLRDKQAEIPDCGWEDVGGLLDVKREMTETLMYPLKYAAKYARYGMSPSKGMLLYGPSGCGKTLVAKVRDLPHISHGTSCRGWPPPLPPLPSSLRRLPTRSSPTSSPSRAPSSSPCGLASPSRTSASSSTRRAAPPRASSSSTRSTPSPSRVAAAAAAADPTRVTALSTR